MDFGSINFLAVLVSAVASMVVGFVWYAKPLFLKPWLKGIGQSEDFADDPNWGNLLLVFVSSFVMAFFVATLLGVMGSNTLAAGLQAGFMIWLGFVATSLLSNNLMAGRGFGVWLIESGNFLVTLLIMGAILAIWQ